jgi:hypothetical protein
MIHERGDLIRDVNSSNLLRFKRDDGSDLIRWQISKSPLAPSRESGMRRLRIT